VASTSIKSDIATNLVTLLATITDFRYVHFDVVRLAASDFQDHEIPALQIIDLAEVATHEGTRVRKSWALAIEVIVGPRMTDTAQPNQKQLWDLMQEVELKIGSQPKLNLATVIHAKLGVSSTDLHLMRPFYLGRIELTVDYYQTFTGTC
jgi:hypothetical protein